MNNPYEIILAMGYKKRMLENVDVYWRMTGQKEPKHRGSIRSEYSFSVSAREKREMDFQAGRRTGGPVSQRGKEVEKTEGRN
jgi:hypothetical protein